MGAKGSSRGGRRIDLIAIHTNEGSNPLTAGPDLSAENLAAYLNRPDVEASYHKICDDDSVVHYLPDERASWALRSGNPRSLNLCFVGWAAWSAAEWLAHDAMLRLGAGQVRTWCARYGIPARHLTLLEVATGCSGIIGHVDWTFGKQDGDHTDPGPHFPWDVFIGMIAGQAKISRQTLRKDLPVQLPRTLPAGNGKPGANWPANEEVIVTSGAVTVVFGYRGAWIAEAWWGPSGEHVVKVDAPIFVDQFNPRKWSGPAGSEFFVIRYAAPAGGSIG
jgi:hypothetical protein